jgi:hypothetical protein
MIKRYYKFHSALDVPIKVIRSRHPVVIYFSKHNCWVLAGCAYGWLYNRAGEVRIFKSARTARRWRKTMTELYQKELVK